MNGFRKPAFFTLSCLLFSISALLGGCNAMKEARERRLAAQINLISTEIQATMQADWTATPAPTASQTATHTLTPTDTLVATATLLPTETPLPATSTPDTRPLPAEWKNWPIVPDISETAKEIFWRGVNNNKTNPNVFSKIGDCQSMPNVFMGIYDMGYDGILADDEQYLQKAIDHFKGSFAMESYAVHDGMGVGSVLTTTWADPKVCQKDENALDCEIRIHNPSIMFINLGTNWISGLGMDVYYDYLREIVQELVDRGILPILSSKADDAEGGNQINEITARVAYEFDVPFYNFWNAAQHLKNGGLSVDNPIYLSVPAWDYRNYHALKLLYTAGTALGLF